MATQEQLAAARSIVKECGIAISDHSLGRLVDAVQPSVVSDPFAAWQHICDEARHHTPAPEAAEKAREVQAVTPVAAEPVTADPDAPKQAADLPDWWDARRHGQGKDKSRCAAELRVALGEAWARVELPTREEIAHGLFDATYDRVGWIHGTESGHEAAYLQADYVLSLLRDRVSLPGQDVAIHIDRLRHIETREADAYELRICLDNRDAELTTLREQLAEVGDAAKRIGWEPSDGDVSLDVYVSLLGDDVTALREQLEAERKAHGETAKVLAEVRESHSEATRMINAYDDDFAVLQMEWTKKVDALKRCAQEHSDARDQLKREFDAGREAAEQAYRDSNNAHVMTLHKLDAAEQALAQLREACALYTDELAAYGYHPHQHSPEAAPLTRLQQYVAKVQRALQPAAQGEGKVKLAHDLPAPRKLTPEQMEACTREAREVQQRWGDYSRAAARLTEADAVVVRTDELELSMVQLQERMSAIEALARRVGKLEAMSTMVGSEGCVLFLPTLRRACSTIEGVIRDVERLDALKALGTEGE